MSGAQMVTRRALCFWCEKETERVPGAAPTYCSEACRAADVKSSRTFDDDDRFRYGEPTRGTWYPWHRDDAELDRQDDGGDR